MIVCIQDLDGLKVVRLEQSGQESPEQQPSHMVAKRNHAQSGTEPMACCNYPGLVRGRDRHDGNLVTEDIAGNMIQVPHGQNTGLAGVMLSVQCDREQITKQVVIVMPNPLTAIERIQQYGSVRRSRCSRV